MNNNKRSIGLSQDTTFFLRRSSANKNKSKKESNALKSREETIEEEEVMQNEKDDSKQGNNEYQKKIPDQISISSSSSISLIEIMESTPQFPVPEAKKTKIETKFAKSPSILDNLDPELLALISSSEEPATTITEDSIIISLKVEVRINNENVCLKTIVIRLGSREPFRKCLEEISRTIKVSLSQLLLCTPNGVRVYPSSTPEILGTSDGSIFHLLDLRGYDTRKYRIQYDIEKAIASKSSSTPLDDVEPTREANITTHAEAISETITIIVKSKYSQAKQIVVERNIPLLPQILAQVEADGKCRFDGQVINSTVTAEDLEMETEDLVDFIHNA